MNRVKRIFQCLRSRNREKYPVTSSFFFFYSNRGASSFVNRRRENSIVRGRRMHRRWIRSRGSYAIVKIALIRKTRRLVVIDVCARASWRAPAASKERTFPLYLHTILSEPRRPCTVVTARRFILRVINANGDFEQEPR